MQLCSENVTLLRSRIFVDKIKFQMTTYWIARGPNPMIGVLRIRGKDTEMEKRKSREHRKERHVTMEAEMGAMYLQVKNTKPCQQPQAWNRLSSGAAGRNQPTLMTP